MTGLQSLRDLGGLGEGAKALIIGAGGGIGSVAVGIGKRLGGHVTAVCGTKDVERVEALGADAVVDRTKSDPLDAESAYDVVFDTPAVYSFGRCAKTLQAGGTYVTTLPDAALVTGMARALFTSKRCRFVQVASKRADLELVGEWLSDGLDVRIDSRHKSPTWVPPSNARPTAVGWGGSSSTLPRGGHECASVPWPTRPAERHKTISGRVSCSRQFGFVVCPSTNS